jgi:hypothetical protein
LAASTPFGRHGWFWEVWAGTAADAHALDLATVEALLADLRFPVEEASEGVSLPALPDDTRAFTWTKTRVIAPENRRLSRRFLAHERRSIPDLWFRQEWLCEFVELGSMVFRYEGLMAMLSPTVQPLFGAEGQILEEERVVSDAVQPLSLGHGGWRQ